MNKFMLAFIAFSAIVSSSMAGSYDGALNSGYVANAPASVGYQAIPLSAVLPVNGPLAYSAPSYRKSARYNLQPIAVQRSGIISGIGQNLASAAPSILIGAASRPVAESSASTSIAGLGSGKYLQLAVPSYELLNEDKLNLADQYGHRSNVYSPSYAGRAAY